LKVGGDFCCGKTCNILLTQLGPPIRWKAACLAGVGWETDRLPFCHGLGGSTLPSSRVLQQPQNKAGKSGEKKKTARGGNRLKSVPRVGDQKESAL